MTTVTAKAARENFSALISSVARGESITITRRGKPVAVVSPAAKKPPRGLPDLTLFRAKMKKPGTPEVTIADLRKWERY
jgi:prevent-host-death family protein